MDYKKYMKPHAIHPRMRIELEKEEKKTGVKLVEPQKVVKPKVSDGKDLNGMRKIIIENKPKPKEVLKYFEAVLEDHDTKRKQSEE